MALVWAVTALLCLGVCQSQETPDSDSLQGALEAINRRQRDLQDPSLYYVEHSHPSPQLAASRNEGDDGQPEDIGYGYQKSFAPRTSGFFEALPLAENELGSNDPGVETYSPSDAKELENIILNYIADNMKSPEASTKRRMHHQNRNTDKRSVFRERDVNIPPEILQNLYSGEDSDRFFESGEHSNMMPSSFRERFPSKHSRHHSAKNAHALVRNFGGLNRDTDNTPENTDDSDEYLSMLNSIWEKYQDKNLDHLDPEDISESDVEEILSYMNHKNEMKRQNYPKYEPNYDFFNSPLAWVKKDNHKMSGKNSPHSNQLLHTLKYLNGHTDTLGPLQEEEESDEERDADVAKLLLDEQGLRKSKRFWRGNTYDEYSVAKRYPIAKRSPSLYTSPAVLYHKHSGIDKYSQRRKKNVKTHISDDVTDPKIAQELNDIFSTADVKNKAKRSNNSSENAHLNHLGSKSSNSTDTDSPFMTQNNVSEKVTSPSTHNSHTQMKRSGQKEETIADTQHKPLEVYKKSIDWSHYFGIDKRRKKSLDKNENDEWLLDQYLKAYSISARTMKDSDDDKDVKSHLKIQSSDDMDEKLRAMEDMIVDQALKYTGAHEGTTDTEQVQAVKDNVIAQLAAAYSLEKMRKALSEFKSSMAAQKASANSQSTTNAPTDIPEQKEKRVAIKKEKAEIPNDVKFEKKDDSDNNIGVLHSISHSKSVPWNQEESCPIMDDITQRCKEIANMAGDRSEAFVPLCNLHQVCYLCGPEMGATASGCDITFLAEANNLCGENPRCRFTVRRTMTTIHSLRGDPSPLGCDWQNHPCLARYLAITKR